jgi:hypothetical protein
MKLETLTADYLASQRARGLSPRSTALTENVLNMFMDWSPDGDIDQRTLDRWSAFLLESHRNPAGKALSRESVRTYDRQLSTPV